MKCRRCGATEGFTFGVLAVVLAEQQGDGWSRGEVVNFTHKQWLTCSCGHSWPTKRRVEVTV